jgi:shikimate dehydrogenase
VTAGITGATRVYLHLAHPSAHARTPQVMNAELARRGVDAVAVSADVAPADLGGFARGLRGWRNLAGLSVTMPHKGSLAAHVDELIDAVNVVRRESDGRLVATNTDGQGFVIGLREAGHELAGRRVLLTGRRRRAGGRLRRGRGGCGRPDDREQNRDPGRAARS